MKEKKDSIQIMIKLFSLMENIMNGTAKLADLKEYSDSQWRELVKFKSPYFNALLSFFFRERDRKEDFLRSPKINLIDKIAFLSRFATKEELEQRMMQLLEYGLKLGKIEVLIIPDVGDKV